MLLHDKQVAIIGGGPGGLTLARLLHQRGVNVKVYERDTDGKVRQQGATLDLHEDTGLKALQAAGLMEAFKKHYRPGADKMRVANSRMELLLDDHATKPEEDFGNEHFRPEIDRGPLRDMLIASLPEDSIVWDARFREMQRCGEGWTILFENGRSVYADLVIAADGANSRLRRYVTDIDAVFSGVTAIEFNIYNAAQHAPRLWALVQGGKLFALEHGKTLLFSAKADGTLSFLAGMKTAEHWLAASGIDFKDKASVSAWFQQEFSGWSEHWQEAFESDALSIVPRPMYHYPVSQSWTPLPNLTLTGDAAHRMPPYAGEGANQALADALELYEALCCGPFETPQQAIAAYERSMLARSAEITAITLYQTDAMHADNNLQYLLDFFGEMQAGNAV